MSILPTEEVVRRISEGESAAVIAEEYDVTVFSVYQCIKRAGHTMRSLQGDGGDMECRSIPGAPGYRVLADGTVQSEIEPGTGLATGNWVDLTPQPRKSGRKCHPVVQLGSHASGTRRRLSHPNVIRAAWGVLADDVLRAAGYDPARCPTTGRPSK